MNTGTKVHVANKKTKKYGGQKENAKRDIQH